VAIIEIAKIQVRRGQENVTGIPQLSPGEFGWAEDTEHLYIGKSTADGAANSNNTRILTQNDLNFTVSVTSSTYQYQGHIPGYYPGYPTTSTVARTFQSKLDDFVTVFDFGATNDGTPTHLQIQAAINAFYADAVLNGNNAARAALRIPAGNYYIGGTIFVPPYVTLIGDGQGKTVLNLIAANGPILQFTDGTNTWPSIAFSTPPNGINIVGITFKYDASIVTTSTSIQPLLRPDCAQCSYIIDCGFVGVNGSTSSNINYTGIDIRGQGSLPTQDLLIQNCTFNGLYYGIQSNYDIRDTVIINSRFTNCNRGVVHGENIALGNFVGPVSTRLENNKFLNINREGFYVGNNSGNNFTNHVSAYNVFREVGNNLTGDLNPVTPIINFLSNGNVSSGDFSTRFTNINSTTTSIVSTASWFIGGSTYINNGSVYSANLTISTQTVSIANLPFNGYQAATSIDYNLLISSANIARKGKLFVNTALLTNGSTATITDNYSYVGSTDGGTIFTASLNTITNSIVLGYINPTYAGTVTYRYSQLQ